MVFGPDWCLLTPKGLLGAILGHFDNACVQQAASHTLCVCVIIHRTPTVANSYKRLSRSTACGNGMHGSEREWAVCRGGAARRQASHSRHHSLGVAAWPAVPPLQATTAADARIPRMWWVCGRLLGQPSRPPLALWWLRGPLSPPLMPPLASPPCTRPKPLACATSVHGTGQERTGRSCLSCT